VILPHSGMLLVPPTSQPEALRGDATHAAGDGKRGSS
jgi:hypothetical protein